MTTPQMSGIPGATVMTDTLDFVKNLWGSMAVPGMNIPGITAPTLSIDDLDKKINDLKAVEAWLSVNMSMLRGTIQALEVQRGTIATLKSMSESFANAVKQPGATDKSLFEAAPYAAAFFPQAATPAKTDAKPASKPSAAAAPPPPAPDAASQMANPAVWWNLLQQQFQQAVSSTMTTDPNAARPPAAAPAAPTASAAPASQEKADTSPAKGGSAKASKA
jgi:cytoskeletal protein RodZ